MSDLGRKITSSVAALTVFALLGTAGHADASPPLGPEISPASSLDHDSRQQVASTQSVLRHVLLTEKPSPALPFYESRHYRPAWTGGEAEEKAARDLRFILARAHEHGLDDDDYRVPESGDESSPGAEAAHFDLALTEAALRYAHDVRVGRVRPRDVYEDVGLVPARFDSAAVLTEALESLSLAAAFAELPPPHSQYRRLTEALAQFRLIAEAGGWPVLRGTEAGVKFDDNGSNLVVTRLAFEDPRLAATPNPSEDELREAVKRFQARNGLAADGVVGPRTIATLNVPTSDRMAVIVANMERWRWMPRQLEHRYIAVNVPDQSLEYVRGGEAVLNSSVIVGREAYPTPIARTAIIAIVANPPWNIPGFIAARDLLPRLRKNPGYLEARNMVVMNGPPGDPSGRTIDWQAIRPTAFPYAIRQMPGPANALGALMLDSPNDFDVYLHDTPGKKLFEQDDRDISNGCVRVEQILPLASLALTGDLDEGMAILSEATASRETQRLVLDMPLPVYFLYWTAFAGPRGDIEFRPDLYGRDEKLIAALERTPHPRIGSDS